MIQINKKQDCSGCHACSNVCPAKCITMEEDKEGFLYPKVDNAKCINCSLCEKVCPIINKKERVNDIAAYACINKNQAVRLESSSGGVFTLLAENVINKGGVVFGAGFDENLNLVHSYTDNIEGLSKFRGSKYLQSKIGDTYSKAKEFLDRETLVLFSGTPCQIAGLIHYLRKDYDNLICVDIICHGVPSPKVFKMYRTEIEKKKGGVTNNIVFRDKYYGWRLYSLKVSLNNNSEYKKDLRHEIYMKGFLQNLYLRPSCHDCKSKTLNRLSDITIADFWKVEKIAAELDDDKGTSLVLIHSNRGKKIFNQLQNEMLVKQIDCNEAIKYNMSAIKSSPINPKREEFFENLDSYSESVSKLIINYTYTGFTRKVYNEIIVDIAKIKRCLKKSK